MENEGKAVVVTTEHRGVFFGYLTGEPSKEKTTLHQARNCLFWSEDTKGFLGLAAHGPLTGSRVGPAVPEITLWDITSVIVCTPDAAQKWESTPW